MRAEGEMSAPAEGTCEEVHAAIKELYRLLGSASPVQSPATPGVGYSVYSYPSPMAPMAGPNACGFVGHPVMPVVQDRQQMVQVPWGAPMVLNRHPGFRGVSMVF